MRRGVQASTVLQHFRRTRRIAIGRDPVWVACAHRYVIRSYLKQGTHRNITITKVVRED